MSSVELHMEELFGKPNINGRIYSKSVWEDALKNFLNNEANMGELNHVGELTHPEEELPLAARIASQTFGFNIQPLKAMTDEEYKEWSKDHQVITKDGITVISDDKIKLGKDGKTIIHLQK